MQYTFVNENTGERFEVTMTAARYSELERDPLDEDRIFVESPDGTMVWAQRDFVSDARSVKGQATGWPMVSQAMANPNMTEAERRAEQAHLERAGVPTQYTALNEPILESRTHRKKYMEAMGMHDRDAGYGDRAPE